MVWRSSYTVTFYIVTRGRGRQGDRVVEQVAVPPGMVRVSDAGQQGVEVVEKHALVGVTNEGNFPDASTIEEGEDDRGGEGGGVAG